ncbi:hypothetical protein BUALT_BualtMtG0006000 (mitochondrion) [Buddleja alternifolia]|uniref:Uncharacterized protein n=1 Tax=Buddleja alternifolia TaxID=168488 RepID=A0AAV6W476_9LAMI|nr:hypothetical protein BUALT_BualtUnG0039400 [Buddleja alternifolia]KAG8363177.1 hypothetical protein BUALT_BualtMtG0006000 [Buddleja alternifolia]
MNEMSGDLPSPLLITKNFVATSGEEKPSHPKTTRSLKRRKFSLQEAGRALANGPHPSILPKQKTVEGQGSLGQSQKSDPNSPQVGFEPTTSQLTADRSTTELLRNNGLKETDSRSLDQPMTEKKRSSSLFFTYTDREKRLR